MATELSTPIAVTQGGMSGVATHEQMGATIQPWNTPALQMYMVAGSVGEDGAFVPLNGLRSDTARQSPDYGSASPAEWAALAALPEWQAALGRALELYDYISSGRDEATRPAWIPTAE